MRSRAVSLPLACCASIRFWPPPRRAPPAVLPLRSKLRAMLPPLNLQIPCIALNVQAKHGFWLKRWQCIIYKYANYVMRSCELMAIGKLYIVERFGMCGKAHAPRNPSSRNGWASRQAISTRSRTISAPYPPPFCWRSPKNSASALPDLSSGEGDRLLSALSEALSDPLFEGYSGSCRT